MSLCDKINEANALGIANLAEKGIGLAGSPTPTGPKLPTTYDIMDAISLIEVGGGGGISYTDIVYNDDNTITLTDTDGAEHTMVCEYTDGKLTSLKFDGKSVALEYDSDVLISVGGVSVDVSNAPTSGGTEEIEQIIDESGVLEDTEGTVTEKVEELIDKAEELDIFMHIINANQLFQEAHSFPTKAIVNLPNAINARETFANWITAPIPIVEEITVNAPNLTEAYRTFWQSWGVKKIILNLSDKCQKLILAFTYARDVKEIVLNFPTQNITEHGQTFSLCGALERIIGVLDFSSTTSVNMMFNNCGSLKEVTFAPNTLSLSISLAQSSKLTNESVDSIIEGLKTLKEGATAQTLTLHKNIVLTDTQKSNIQAKRWTLVQ